MGAMTGLNFNGENSKKSQPIEITVQVRDKRGDPTGQTKSFSSENCFEVSDWYNKQKPLKKRKTKRNKKSQNNNREK